VGCDDSDSIPPHAEWNRGRNATRSLPTPAEYRLVAKKGEGTFSEVLKAQCIKSSKYVAIKCMKNHFESLDQVNNLREIQVSQAQAPGSSRAHERRPPGGQHAAVHGGAAGREDRGWWQCRALLGSNAGGAAPRTAVHASCGG
jgi:hypothetical protein